MRVCQPSPLARNAAKTSASSRSLTGSFVIADLGRPRDLILVPSYRSADLKNAAFNSGASSGSLQVAGVERFFAVICFPHADLIGPLNVFQWLQPMWWPMCWPSSGARGEICAFVVALLVCESPWRSAALMHRFGAICASPKTPLASLPFSHREGGQMTQRHANDKHLSLNDNQLSIIYNNMVCKNWWGDVCPA